MATSRRGFLKKTIAGAAVGWEEMQRLAAASGKPEVPAAGTVNARDVSPPSAESRPIAGNYTRGLGVYPGEPREDFSPVLVKDDSTYRNLALRRPAYHSSSYDYNLTAQLVTDGIKDTRLPETVLTGLSTEGILPKREREFFLDHNATSTVSLRGSHPYVEVRLGNGEDLPEIDRVDVLAVVRVLGMNPQKLTFTVSASEDGREWKELGRVTGPPPASIEGHPPRFAKPGQLFKPSIPLTSPTRSRYFRVELGGAATPVRAVGVPWQIGQVAFYRQGRRVDVGGPYSFTSAWMSAGLDEEWVYVDLGARCEFDRVVLSWIARAAEGSVQVSDDAVAWRDLQALSGGTSLTDDLKLSPPARGRYVRVLMKRPASPRGYVLSEIEVYGRGGFVARPQPASAPRDDGRLDLAGGAWKLQRDSLVKADGPAVARPGFKDDDWIVATVPGTVLTSYLNVGAIPDPNYGDNQLQISDSFFYADFWYRTEFTPPRMERGRRARLNFDGINWKAEVFLNGAQLGRMEGAFMRGRFDVTERLLPGQTNALAVRIEKNDTPGSAKQKTFDSPGQNGGALGLDNPTFHASIGWDWIPTIRGRNAGIWNGVYLTFSGPVTLQDPFITTTLPLPKTDTADVKIEVEVRNHEPKRIKGKLRGRLGEARFEQRVMLQGGERLKVRLDPSTHPVLRLQNPKLWWPVGYGEPDLYDLELEFEARRHKVSDRKALKVGVRQMSYSEEGGALKIWVNGRRLVARGGNWGFSESQLRYRTREYDAAVRYHREMNFTMIRNWVGQVGEDAFYDACDRHGVMVWQGFWLANPWDGPDPEDDGLFMRNVKDTVLRIRNHPCLALYCGRNEGYPPKPLETGITQALAELHPGLHYIPNSARGVVGGGGPYHVMPRRFYFTAGSATKLHSEMGMPNIPPIESVRRMMPGDALWPQGLTWGLHDFCLGGAQNGESFRNRIEYSYGGAGSAEEWVQLAQFVNYDGYRAMFEGQSRHRMGLLIWMSHPCWPSFVWQTYDYYFEPTAAYFGCKKACEPLHIQWNPATESVEVVNLSGGNARGLVARAEVLNMDGSRQWEKTASLDSPEDSTASCIKIEYPAGLTSVHFLRLRLTREGKAASENFYLRGLEEERFGAIRTLPKVQLEAATRAARQNGRWQLTTELHNPSLHPALMVRLKAVREKSGDCILPALYSDNYVALMPGERRTISIELADADTRGEKPRIVVEGFNAQPVTAS
jgi:Glycosyl hydrolase 2 galactose-binding domain-like/Exo-beta-D-glucosaminidase Ig-fold domain/Glycosyl hydrolases family 2/NedA-like, galactose-binding domain